MGCGCGGGGRRSGNPARGIRPIAGPRVTAQNGLTPSQARAVSAQSAITSQNRTMDAEKRRIAKLRRDAIRKSLGR